MATGDQTASNLGIIIINTADCKAVADNTGRLHAINA